MNPTEFKAAIRPQLENQICEWIWNEVDTATLRQIAARFQSHVRSATKKNEDSTLFFAICLLPESFDPYQRGYITKIADKLLEIFLVDVARFDNVDRSCKTCLRINAYKYRLSNFLKEVAYYARIAADANKVPHVMKRARKEIQPDYEPGVTGEVTRGLKELRFA